MSTYGPVHAAQHELQVEEKDSLISHLGRKSFFDQRLKYITAKDCHQ